MARHHVVDRIMIKTVAWRRPSVKARSKELLDRALAATVAAIEIYNKPDFPYREETFAVLAINGWELLFKAKWLADHGNKVGSLYVLEERLKLDGSKSKKFRVKVTRSGNPPYLPRSPVLRQVTSDESRSIF